MEPWLASERNVRVCALLGALTIAFSRILVRLGHASPSTAAIFPFASALPVLVISFGGRTGGSDRGHGRSASA